MTYSKRLALLNELKKRKLEEIKPVFRFEDFAFKKQFEFFRADGPRFRTAVCSRRAGKTVGIAGDAIDTCLNEPGVECLYITITKENVRNIIWGDINKLIEKYKLPCHVDNLRLEVQFDNGSVIRTGGAKDATEIEKYRGRKLRKVYIDECQSMRPHIKKLIKDILLKTLSDLRGNLYLTGTPGPVKAGAFYEYSHRASWLNCYWTAFDNPNMHNPEKGLDYNVTLKEEQAAENIDENDPSYQRETFGLWVEDTDSLVFKYNEEVNDFVSAPNSELTYILGADIGYIDSDAIVILAYSHKTNEVYLVEEVEKSKLDITSLAEEIKKLQHKYNPVKMVMDAGALGKKIQEELRFRHQLAIEAADKARKFEHIEFLNADLRRGVFKARRDSLFAQDCKLVTWDRSNPEKPKISSTYHSDVNDAVLYAYMLCRHYIKNDVVVKPSLYSTEYMDNYERNLDEKLRQRQEDPDMYELEEMMNDSSDDFNF